MMDDAVQPCRPPGTSSKHSFIKALGKNPLLTVFSATEEAARNQVQQHATAGARQIYQSAEIMTVHPA